MQNYFIIHIETESTFIYTEYKNCNNNRTRIMGTFGIETYPKQSLNKYLTLLCTFWSIILDEHLILVNLHLYV